MLFEHYSLAPWEKNLWPNFAPVEFACRHCGEFFWAPEYFIAAQKIREALEKPLHINSGHRCPIHNAMVGGAPLSEHKRIALDLSLRGHSPANLLGAAIQAGFTSFGYYGTFLHCDFRPGRRWATAKGRKTWNGLMV